MITQIKGRQGTTVTKNSKVLPFNFMLAIG